MIRRSCPEAQIPRAVFEHLRLRGAPRVFAFHPANGASITADKQVRNDHSDDGLWRIRGKRQVVYAKASLSNRDRLVAVSGFEDGSLAEIFLNTCKHGTAVDVNARDAARGSLPPAPARLPCGHISADAEQRRLGLGTAGRCPRSAGDRAAENRGFRSGTGGIDEHSYSIGSRQQLTQKDWAST
jgi:hypothetical protein